MGHGLSDVPFLDEIDQQVRQVADKLRERLSVSPLDNWKRAHFIPQGAQAESFEIR